MGKSDKSLKSKNLKWLWSVVALDAIALVLVAFPGLLTSETLKDFAWVRVLVAGIAPVVVLLLTSLLSADGKAVIVFWRVKETLPGHRAFSVYAPRDSRINVDALRKNVGTFPDDPREQNTLWFKLYKKVESEVTVAQAHRHYLLFRDLAAMSLLLAPLATLALYLSGSASTATWIAFAILCTQYAATALAARNDGIRFVTNVLTLHSVKRRA
jgi:fatty-acid desaturase